ncbi:MAG: CotH kinase family protein [Bacteroidales bacterium]|nr:CotH kinase family protein [Bacteroidales bacterium]
MKIKISSYIYVLILIVNNFAYSQEFSSSNLPIIIIETNGQVIPDEPKITVEMGIIYNGEGQRNYVSDPFNNYDGLVGIEKRGSSSQMFPKKQYAFETRDSFGNNLNVSLLGMPEENDWILYAPYSDKSLMRNVLTFKLTNDMGYYASRTCFCELVLNGEYMGIYVLMEKIKRDKNRVDIAKMDEDDLSGDSLTGGYIVKIDKTTGSTSGGWYSTFPPYPGSWQNIYYQYHYPNADVIQYQQKEYIEDFIYEFESTMDSDEFNDPESGYASIIDVNNFADYIIINELGKSVDSYRYSTFLHKDRESIDGRLKMGPIWDFNLAFGNADYFTGFDPEGFMITYPDFPNFIKPFWWEKLFTDAKFFQNIVLDWNIFRQDVLHLDSIYNYIDCTAEFLNESQERNFERWPILGQYVWPNYFIGATYEEEIQYLKEFITERIEWLDVQFKIQPVITEINYHSSPEFNAGDWLEIYNPTDEDLDVSNWILKNDEVVFFVIPYSTIIPADSFLVICENLSQFNAAFPENINCIGDLYVNFNDQGTSFELSPPDQLSIDMLTFTDSLPWPATANGTGKTIELNNYLSDNSKPENWHASLNIGGSPGRRNPAFNESNLYINEFMASNDTAFPGPQNDYPDWIEIYNSGNNDVMLGGFYLSDKLENIEDRFQISDTYPDSVTVAAGGYLVFYANGSTSSVLNLNFKLSGSGEEIGFWGPDGISVIDTLSYEEQTTDYSFGRYPDGSNDWFIMANFSPGFSNIQSSQTIEIHSGYQFVSSYFSPENTDMLEVVSEILTDDLIFMRNSEGEVLRKIGTNWINGIGDWVVTEGYLIKFNGSGQFTISGEISAPTTPIILQEGFQFVSYLPVFEMNALVAFASILGEKLSFIRNSSGMTLQKIGPNWVNGIGDCKSGEGYLIKMNEAEILIYPE